MTTDSASPSVRSTRSRAAELEAISRAGFAKLARRDLSEPHTIWAEDAVDHFLPVGDAIGRDAIVAFFDEMFTALPDFSITVERITSSDTVSVVQWHATGTFTGGRFQGIRPTGKPIEFRGCDVVLFQGDVVIDNTVYWDGLAFARAIGLLPSEGSVGDRILMSAFNALTAVRTLGGRRFRTRTLETG